MFKRVLVANRGEIALRVVRALKELGVESVVAYSTVDKDTLAVREADRAVCIGPGPSAQSYLDIARIIGAATSTGCEAVHPGYGFLSESSEFARACQDNGLVFIGPSPEVIDRMGEKSNAKQTMIAAGVPCVPGSDGEVETVEEAAKFASEVGYPVLIKASAGGGGKGMREVHAAADLKSQYDNARAEARVAFGNDAVYLEKLISRPRHVEVQVLADEHGHVAALCERDCSVQRRHQKLIEEAPSPALDADLRARMCKSACDAVRHVGYTNAGTIEFLLDEDGSYYFMEMNTRIQVEHGVTEQITLTDLVAEQLRIAAGEDMTVPDGGILEPVGHCFEFRINAEDPEHGFRPNPGKITRLELPGGPGVRVDTHIYAGYTVPPTYDSLIAKLIVWGPTREAALARAARALDEFKVEGIATTIPFHKAAIRHPEFVAGEETTDFIPKCMPEFLG
jgi:acetyl-CoA carboxylase biotin carboxylase subunit